MKTTLRLLAFALTLLGAGASASNFYGYKAPLPNVTITAADNLVGFKVTVTTGGALQAFGANFRAASGNGSMGLYAADGANGDPGTLVAQTGSFAIAAAGVLQLPPTAPVTLAAGDYWIMADFSEDAYPGYDYFGTAADVIKYRALPFSGSLPATFGATSVYTGAKLNYYIKVAGSIHAVLYTRNAKVPGAGDASSGIPADALFTDFGSPTINGRGDIAFLGKWVSKTSGPGAGIFLREFTVTSPQGGVPTGTLAKVGDTVRSGGSVIKSLEDVVGIDEQKTVAFTAVLVGPATARARENARKSSCQNNLKIKQAPVVLAEEGQPAPVPGALWKTIRSSALTPHGDVLIDGTLALRRGVVTAKDDHVLVAARAVDLAGNTSSEGITTLLREGVTPIQNNGALGMPNNNEVQRIRTFEVFPPVRGGTGVFNDSEVVFRATSTGSATLLSRGDFQAMILHYR